jgi:hypothetical protein
MVSQISRPSLLRFISPRIALALPFLLAVCGPSGRAAGTGVRTPILMELFTSEGCSSCPPVDVWVQKLDAAQPIPGAELIVLSEHVDYWNHDGWKDPFSSAQMTERQQEYMRRFGSSEVYTPQIILDGDVVLQPSQPEQIRQSFTQLSAAPMLPVRIESSTLEAGDPGTLTGEVTVDGAAQKLGGDVYLAIALDKTVTDVLAGENDGKKLTNVAVVKDLVKIGKVEKGRDFQKIFRVKLWSGVDPRNLRVVAFVQEAGEGKVVGATMTRAISTQTVTASATQRSASAE